MSNWKRVLQDIKSSAVNFTITNLAAAATFTGTAEETFGINGIQVYHYATQDCTIYIDQGVDGTNWDIVDSFPCLANNACTRTFISVAPYFRLRVTNTGTATTTAIRTYTGLTPIINPLPRALDNDRLKTKSTMYDDVSSIQAKIAPFGKLKVVNPVRTIGASFSGTTLDPNFWSDDGCTLSGTVTQTGGGEVIVSTGTTATAVAQLQSVRRSRHVAGAADEFKFTGRLSSALDADNVRQGGVYDDDNGFYFQVDGSTFGVGIRKGGVDTVVQSGSFNGDYGPSLAMDTSMGNFVIWYWERTVYFFVNGKILHKVSATTESLSETLNLPIRFESINTGANTTDNTFEILVASVFRLGDLQTSPKSYYAVNGTTILKYGAGFLHRIAITDTSGDMLIYDGLSAAGTLIANLDASKTTGTIELGIPFSNGLTVVVTSGPKMTVVYE